MNKSVIFGGTHNEGKNTYWKSRGKQDVRF